MMKLACLAAALFAFGACAGDDGGGAEVEIVDAELSGLVEGQNWTFVAGDTDEFLSRGDEDFFATLYPETFPPCGFSAPTGSHLIVSIPKTTGDFAMNFSRNMTFVVGDSDNLVSFDGHIRVDSVTDTLVTGGMYAKFDDDNEVNGTFSITVCPPSP